MLGILEQLQNKTIDDWHNDLWVVILAIEHERIHLETSAVIIRRLPVQMMRKVEEFVECP